MTTNNSLPDFASLLMEDVVKTFKGMVPEDVLKNFSPEEPNESPEETAELNHPFLEAQRVLNKVEEIADSRNDMDAKASLLLSVAAGHTEIGRQLLDSFDF